MARPLIDLREVTKVYRTGDVETPVLHGVSLTIEAGEFVAILGASGSGKSTLMNILGCLDTATAGTYHLLGRDVGGLDRDHRADLRRDVFGFVFQQYNLLPDATASENVEIPAIYAGRPAKERVERAHELLGRLGLSDRVDHRPRQLSGGQQQRVSIARALMNGGQVILADEPTGALDSTSGRDVMALLDDLNRQGHTVIVITHDPDVAAKAHRRVRVADGRIVSDDGGTAGRAVEERPLTVTPPSLLSDMGETVLMATRSMRANLFRTVLTLLGIVIGVGSVIAMLAIGDGAKQDIVGRIQAMGTDLLVVRPGGPQQRGRGDITTLKQADMEAVRQLPGVSSAVPENQGSATVRVDNLDHRTSITATSAEYADVQNWGLKDGVFFSAQDVREYAPVAVLGQTVYQALFPNGDSPLGTYVLISNVPFQVIGVLDAKGAAAFGRDQDDVVFVPLSTGSLRLFGQHYLNSLTVRVETGFDMDAVQGRVEDLLLARHGTEDFRVRNMASLLEAVTETQNTFTLLLGSIAAISLLVGGIGVMNIMLVSVTERTREIGIRMATGARSANIQLQFLTEALVVCCTGGLLGVVGGLATAWLIGQLGTPTLVTAPPVILAFSCAAVTGLTFGYLPARKASRLDPVTALGAD